MQTALFGIWTQVAESNSYNDNCYPIYPTPPLGQDMTKGQFF